MYLSWSLWDALGNKIVLCDLRKAGRVHLPLESITASFQSLLLFDQIVFWNEKKVCFYNRDGSFAKNCGNGLRALGMECLEIGINPLKLSPKLPNGKKVRFKLLDHQLWVSPFSFSIEIKKKKKTSVPMPFQKDIQDLFLVSLGNDHLLCRSEQKERTLLRLARAWKEKTRMYNLSFFSFLGPHQIWLRTFERGAGMTGSCASAACAASFLSWKKFKRSAPFFVFFGDKKKGPLCVRLQERAVWVWGSIRKGSVGKIKITFSSRT